VQEKASFIKYQSIRLRDLVNDLNLITRLGDDTQPVHWKLFHPTTFCRELIAEFLNNGIPKNYSIELDIEKGLEPVKIKGDTHLLQRAINNLLHNSIRHNPNGCTIYFRLYEKEQHILFVVSDDGKGMTSNEIEVLRNRSHYLTKIASSLNKQHGLGLYIVQQIVKMHSGNTSFEKSESGGLEVTIEIPIL
jgi:signal transduction histidine kinase